jgi:hypothetical protein
MKRRSANWDLDPFEERLLERLRGHVATREPSPDMTAVSDRPTARGRPAGRLRSFRSLSALAAIGAAAVALVLVLLSSGSAPAPALAFPILNQPAVALPKSAAQIATQDIPLQTRSLHGGQVNTSTGRAFPTPWGRGYVLSDKDKQIACVLIRAWHDHWQLVGCIGPQTASHKGGNWVEYWGSKLKIGREHPNTAVDVEIIAQGGTLTAQRISGQPHQNGRPHQIALHGGVAVTLIHHTTMFTTQVDGHTSQSVAWDYTGFDGGAHRPPPGLLREVKRLDPSYP